jgi:hypothetical protein
MKQQADARQSIHIQVVVDKTRESPSTRMSHVGKSKEKEAPVQSGIASLMAILMS